MNNSRLAIWQIYLVGVMCCGAITGAVALGFVSPAIQRAHRRAALEQTLCDRQQRVSALSTELTALHRQRDNLLASVHNSTLALSPSTQVNSRLALLAILAGEHGLTLDEIRAGSPAEGANLGMLPIFLSSSGSYPNCARFLHHLREKYPDMAVKTLESAAESKGRASAFRFELTWYTKKGSAS